MRTIAALLSLGAVAQAQEVSLEHFAQRGSAHDGLVVSKSGLRVCVAGTLEFSEVWGKSEALAKAILVAADLDAVGLGREDLQSTRRPWISEGSIRFVCANVAEESSGKLLANPYVVRESGKTRIAMTGVVRRASVSGLRVTDPVEALRSIVKELEGKADLIVVLAEMAREDAAAILRAFPESPLAVLVPTSGPNDPEPIAFPKGVLVQSPTGGGTIGRLTLSSPPSKASNRLSEMEATEQDRAKLKELYARHGETVDLGKFVREERAPKERNAIPLSSLEPDTLAALGVSARNRAARLTLHSALATGEFGGRKAPEGSLWLVLDSEWENLIPMSFVFERRVPVEYRVTELGDHAYLVVNGSRVGRLDRELSSGPGGVVEKPLSLPHVGSARRGHVVFSIPSSRVTSLELRFYDFAHGHMAVPVLRKGEIEPREIRLAQKNEVVNLGIVHQRTSKERAPEGMAWFEVEIAATSRFTFESDATAFDPKAKKGTRAQIGTVCDWKEARKYVHLLVDGEFAYRPEAASTLEEEPRFLPDVPTGGSLVFLVPEKRASVELRCDFPNAQTPRGKVIHPRSLAFELEGKRPSFPKREEIAKVDDDVFHVSIVGQAVGEKFGLSKAEEGSRFLILDVSVRNSGKSGEWFQTPEQLHYASEGGDQLPLHAATYQGPRRPWEHVWIPAGERRSFQIVFEIPATEKKPRLAYSGVSKAEVLALKPLQGGEEK